jgi:outer membrane protein assembly factor BamB
LRITDARLLWQAQIGDGGGGCHSGPVVCGETAFVVGRSGPNEVVYAFDAATGAERWQFTYPVLGKLAWGTGSRATPSIADGRVYVLGPLGHLHCLKAKSGEKIWDRHLVADLAGRRPKYGMAASPVVTNGRVICQPGGKGTSVVALDASTGTAVWSTGHDMTAYATPVIAELGGTRQVLAFLDSGLVALDLVSGKELWRYAFSDRQAKNIASPLVAGDRVIIANHTLGFMALRVARTGATWRATVMWKKPHERIHFSQPVKGDGCLWYYDGKGGLRCLDLDAGARLWRAPELGKRHATLIGLDDTHLLASLDTGEVVQLEVDRGAVRELGRFRALQSTSFAHPALAGGRLFWRDDRQIKCWDLPRKSVSR